MNHPAHFTPHTAFTGFTAAEFLRFVDCNALGDLRVELIEGEIVKMMPSYLAHGELNMEVGARLLPLFAGTARVAVDLMIAVTADTIRTADLAVVRPDAPRHRPVDPGDVLLVVEIAASSLSEDLGAKLDHYAAAGIDAYWVFDLGARIVHFMGNPYQGTYRQRRVVAFGEPIAVPGTDATITIA